MFDFGFYPSFTDRIAGTVAPSNDFIIRVKTDNAGTSATNQFTLPTTNIGVVAYDYTIDWGDGTIESINVTTAQTHTYPTAGEYTITISGIFPRIYFNNGGDKLKLIETVNFGDVGWTSMERAFFGCNNMTISLTCTGVMPSGSYVLSWQGCSSLTSFPALDLSGGTNFQQTWQGCSSLTSFNATAMGSGSYFLSWQGCSSLTSFPALDLSGGTNFRSTWQGCSSLTSFPVLDLSGGTNFTSAWQGCSSLTSFPVLDLSGGTNFTEAWQNCSSLTSFNATAMGSGSYFRAWQNCSSLTSFPALDLNGGTTFTSAWQGMGVLTSFATRKFYNMTLGSNCFNGTTLPTADYSDILITQNANNPNNSVNFHGGSSTYNSSALSARSNLVTTKLWTITDAGLV
jgi:hypothetical protein